MEEKGVREPDTSSTLVDNIQDEDLLRQMWTEASDGEIKKQIRLRMYKLREQRLKEFYNQEGILENILKTGSKDTDTDEGVDSITPLPSGQSTPSAVQADQNVPELIGDLCPPIELRQQKDKSPDTELLLPTLVSPRDKRKSKSPSPIPSLPKTKSKSNDTSTKPKVVTGENETSSHKNPKATKIQEIRKPKSENPMQPKVKTPPPPPPPKPKQKGTLVSDQSASQVIANEKLDSISSKPKTKIRNPKPTDSKNSKIFNSKNSKILNLKNPEKSSSTSTQAVAPTTDQPIKSQESTKTLPRFMAPTKSKENAAIPNPNIKSSYDNKASIRSQSQPRSSSGSRRPNTTPGVPSAATAPLVIFKGRGNKLLPPPPSIPKSSSITRTTPVSQYERISREERKPSPSAKPPSKTSPYSPPKNQSSSTYLSGKSGRLGPRKMDQLEITGLDLLDSYLEGHLSSPQIHLEDPIGSGPIHKDSEMASNRSPSRSHKAGRRDVQETGEEPIVTKTEYKYNCDDSNIVTGRGPRPVSQPGTTSKTFGESVSQPTTSSNRRKVLQDSTFKIPSRPGQSARQPKEIPCNLKTIRKPDAKSRKSSTTSSSSGRSLSGSLDNLRHAANRLTDQSRLRCSGIVSKARNVFEKRSTTKNYDSTTSKNSSIQVLSIGTRVGRNKAKFEARARGEYVPLGETLIADVDAVIRVPQGCLPERQQLSPLPYNSKRVDDVRRPAEKAIVESEQQANDKFSIVELVESLPSLKPLHPMYSLSPIPLPKHTGKHEFFFESPISESTTVKEGPIRMQEAEVESWKQVTEKTTTTTPNKQIESVRVTSGNTAKRNRRLNTTAEVTEQLFADKGLSPIRLRNRGEIPYTLDTTADIEAQLFGELPKQKRIQKHDSRAGSGDKAQQAAKPGERSVSRRGNSSKSPKADVSKSEQPTVQPRYPSKSSSPDRPSKSTGDSGTNVEGFLTKADLGETTEKFGKKSGAKFEQKPWGGKGWKPVDREVIVGNTTSADSTDQLSPHLQLITSPYGAGPVDEDGTPLFGLAALRYVKKLGSQEEQRVLDSNENLLDTSTKPKETFVKPLPPLPTSSKYVDKVTPMFQKQTDRPQMNKIDNSYEAERRDPSGSLTTSSLPEINSSNQGDHRGRTLSVDQIITTDGPKVLTEPQRKVRDIARQFEKVTARPSHYASKPTKIPIKTQLISKQPDHSAITPDIDSVVDTEMGVTVVPKTEIGGFADQGDLSATNENHSGASNLQKNDAPEVNNCRVS